MPTQSPAAAPCLTHHQILELIEPFIAQGFKLDLADSDRSQRRLRFRAGAVFTTPGQTETLRLDSPVPGRFELTRSVELAAAAPATLHCQGDDPKRLLHTVQAFDARRCFLQCDGYRIAWQRQLSPNGEATLRGAVAQWPGLTMTLTVAQAGGRATIHLEPRGARLCLPEDLFAVLGRRWSLLQPEGSGWRLTLRLGATNAQALFELAARHLHGVLAEPPACFHQRHRLARWVASARRSLLVAAWAALLLLVASAQWLLTQGAAWPLLLAAVPLGLLWLGYQGADLPQWRWPRRPLAPTAARWLEPRP